MKYEDEKPYPSEPPVRKAAESRHGDYTETHPAYGLVDLMRVHSHPGVVLYGSEILHGETMRITVREAQTDRTLNSDFRHANRHALVEFEMSAAQWAQFVSSVGMGGGTAVTLRRKPEAPAVQVPLITRQEKHRQQFDRELVEKIDRAVAQSREAVAELKALLENSGGKRAMREQLSTLDAAIGNLPSNLNFLRSRFAEDMGDIAEAAKSEVEAFVANTVIRTGLTQLREMAQGLPGRTEVTLLTSEDRGIDVIGDDVAP